MSPEHQRILVISQGETVHPTQDDVTIRIFRKIRYRCRENLTGETKVILTVELSALLESVDQVRKLARHNGQKLSFIIEQFATILLSSGAIIRTNSTAARHVFDDDRFEALILATTTGNELIPPRDLQKRLENLLHIDPQVSTETPAAPQPPESKPTPSLDELIAPPAEPILSLREKILQIVFESLSDLLEKFPALEIICRELAAMAESANQDAAEETQTCALSLGEQLHALVTEIEDAALELLATERPEKEIKIVEKIVERIVHVPVFDETARAEWTSAFTQQQQLLATAVEKLTAAAQTVVPAPIVIAPSVPETTPDFSAEISALEKQKEQLVPSFEAIRAEEETAQEIDEDLSQQIQTLRDKLRYLGKDTQAINRAVLAEALNRQTAVQAHLDELQNLRQPIEDAISQINKRLHVLRACQRKLELPEITIPEIPKLNISATSAPPTIVASEQTPAGPVPDLDEEIDSDENEPTPDAPRVAATPPPETVRPQNYYHQLALISFFVCGPNPFKKVADALAEMQILSDPIKRANFLTACENNPAIKHHERLGIFKLAAKIFYAPWMDEILSESQQKELCRRVNHVPDNRSPLELLVIAALATFKSISAFWLATYLTRTKLIHRKEDRTAVMKICPTESKKVDGARFISQGGHFGDQVMYARAAGADLSWTTAILSLREQHLLFEAKRAETEKHAKTTD